MPKIEITHDTDEPEEIAAKSSSVPEINNASDAASQTPPVKKAKAPIAERFDVDILLVDDDRFITVAYKEGFEHAGHLVVVAGDGVEALEVLKKTKPRLIVLDLIMPRMNGFELLQEIHLDNVLKDIPVLILTNLNQQSDIDEAQSYGIVDFIIKADISLPDLVSKIDEIISK
ncbi:MAG: response regulator [Candidatus Saccharimonadales bacterium]